MRCPKAGAAASPIATSVAAPRRPATGRDARARAIPCPHATPSPYSPLPRDARKNCCLLPPTSLGLRLSFSVPRRISRTPPAPAIPDGLTRAVALGFGCLALVQAPVCRLQQLWRCASVLRIEADANADAQLRLFPPIAHGPLDALRNTVCHARVGVDQNHGEFVTAIPRGQIGGAALVRNYVGQSLERTISRQMSVLVVDCL